MTLFQRTCLRQARQANLCLRQQQPSTILRFNSTTTAPASPPLLLKMRQDLKTAMRAKDTAKLNVLRGLLAEVTNQSKTSSPINTDMQLVSLLRKKSSQAQAAAKEFEGAGRTDLKEKEDAAIVVLEEYAGSVEMVGEEEISTAVRQAIETVKSEGKKSGQGEMMKMLFGPGGSLEGKNVDKSVVAKEVKGALAT